MTIEMPKDVYRNLMVLLKWGGAGPEPSAENARNAISTIKQFDPKGVALGSVVKVLESIGVSPLPSQGIFEAAAETLKQVCGPSPEQQPSLQERFNG